MSVKNKELHRQLTKEWKNRNKEKCRESNRQWYASNLEKAREYQKQYRKANPCKVKNYCKNATAKRKERLNKDLNFKIAHLLRARLGRAVRKQFKIGSAVKDLGCSISEFKIYLESKFQPGMTWDNYGKGNDKWQIDHIIPLCLFDLTKREDLLKACNYTNLQPLWTKANLIKRFFDGSSKYFSL